MHAEPCLGEYKNPTRDRFSSLVSDPKFFLSTRSWKQHVISFTRHFLCPICSACNATGALGASQTAWKVCGMQTPSCNRWLASEVWKRTCKSSFYGPQNTTTGRLPHSYKASQNQKCLSPEWHTTLSESTHGETCSHQVLAGQIPLWQPGTFLFLIPPVWIWTAAPSSEDWRAEPATLRATQGWPLLLLIRQGWPRVFQLP